MGTYTTNLNLYNTNMTTDGNDTFDFQRDINDNNDKIDTFAGVTNTSLANKLNKQQTSNCILEMPSTAPSYNGLTITIPAGLKVLIPNGRNTDGSCNNVEYTLISNKTYTIESPSSNDRWLVFIQQNGSLWLIPKQHINNTSQYVFYDYINNLWYSTYYGQQAEYMCLIGECKNNTTTITEFRLYNGVRLLNYNDKHNIIAWNFPSGDRFPLSLGASSGQIYYTAPLNGYFSINCQLSTNRAAITINNSYGFSLSHSRIVQAGERAVVFAPCRAGDKVYITYDGTATDVYFQFIVATGESADYI